MIQRRTLRRIHLVSTIWFIACIGYILVQALRQADVPWWQIGLSGPPLALVVFLLVNLYLFALYRGIGEAQKIEVEHPLTTASYYMALYVAAPLLGGLAGVLSMVGVTNPLELLSGVAVRTLGTTFVFWVGIDPVAGMLEMLLPASRKHRTQRLAQAEALRRARQEKREHLLAEAMAREERDHQQWQQKLPLQAQRLAALLACNADEFARAEREAVDIGAEAWHLGGLSCMRQLRDMAIQVHKERDSRGTSADYLSYWWDGIGDWRRPSLD
jgi:hypothetical protein